MNIIINIIIIIILVSLSGLFSGLTLGLMSLSIFGLKRKIKLGDKDASKVYPLRRKGNLLLCTLILGNVAVNALLSIFLGSVTTGMIAWLSATSLIVIFGEVLPQAAFHRYALKFGSRSVPLVKVIIFLFYPISKPLSILVDKILGGEELMPVMSKEEFRIFINQQKSTKKSDLKEHEFKILERGLVFSGKTVKDAMTHIDNAFFIYSNTKLNSEILTKIRIKGHSRLPVYDKYKNSVVGILYAKDLISIDPYKDLPVNQVMRKKVQYIKENDKLDFVLNLFKKTKIHLFVVKGKSNSITGIITLEDVIEEIVGEIIDEYDLMRYFNINTKRTKDKFRGK